MTGKRALLAPPTLGCLGLRTDVLQINRRSEYVDARNQADLVGDLIAPLAASVGLNELPFEPELVAQAERDVLRPHVEGELLLGPIADLASPVDLVVVEAGPELRLSANRGVVTLRFVKQQLEPVVGAVRGNANTVALRRQEVQLELIV